MTKKNTGKQAALAAALTLLGTSLSIGTQANAGTDTTGLFLKGHDTTSTIHKDTTGTQNKVDSFTVKQKLTTTGTTQKGTPSAMFLKYNGMDKSKQQK